jgi:hypothetical protein
MKAARGYATRGMPDDRTLRRLRRSRIWHQLVQVVRGISESEFANVDHVGADGSVVSTDAVVRGRQCLPTRHRRPSRPARFPGSPASSPEPEGFAGSTPSGRVVGTVHPMCAPRARGDVAPRGHQGCHAPPPSAAQAATLAATAGVGGPAAGRESGGVGAAGPPAGPGIPGAWQIWRTCEPGDPCRGFQNSQAHQPHRRLSRWTGPALPRTAPALSGRPAPTAQPRSR